MDNITEILAKFAADLVYEDLPKEVAERTKLLFLDMAGIIVRARHDAESTPSLIRAVERLGLTGGTCSVIGDERTYVPSAAALINGTLAHSLDFDDTHAEGSLHSSAPIVPAALAAAQMSGASGRELIAAAVAGYEIQIRLSLALNPAEHYARGFHPTATCGVFGATAAAGKLLGLDAAGLESAFGIALSQAAGSMQFLSDGSWTKRSHVGQAAQNGLMAATLAAEGFKGPKQAIEGEAGFLHAYAPAADPARAIAGLGSSWETMGLAVKPFPSCRYSHAAMEALIELRKENNIEADEVEAVEIGLPKVGMRIIGDPEDVKQAPKTVVDGQFSMPFCAAVIVRQGDLKWDDYAQHLADEKTLALCRRVTCYVDDDAEAAFPKEMSGKARIITDRGTFEKFVAIPRGEPANFLSEDDFRRKFDDLARPYLGDGVDRFADTLLALETANDVGAVIDLGRPSRA